MLMEERGPLQQMDTSLLLSYARGDSVFREAEDLYGLAVTPMQVPFISYVNIAEIRSLERRLQWGEGKSARLNHLLNRSRVLMIHEPGILAAYINIDNFCVRQGIALGKNDLWIAATATALGATLFTSDKDFAPLDPVFLTQIYIPRRESPI